MGSKERGFLTTKSYSLNAAGQCAEPLVIWCHLEDEHAAIDSVPRTALLSSYEGQGGALIVNVQVRGLELYSPILAKKCGTLEPPSAKTGSSIRLDVKKEGLSATRKSCVKFQPMRGGRSGILGVQGLVSLG